jgi:hypothetical protein
VTTVWIARWQPEALPIHRCLLVALRIARWATTHAPPAHGPRPKEQEGRPNANTQPEIQPTVLPFSAIAGVLGEVTFIEWLLVKGVRTPPAEASAIADGRGSVLAGRTAEGSR